MEQDLFYRKDLGAEPHALRPVGEKRRIIMGELKDKAKGIANEIAGNTKQASSDPETRAEGRAQERKGEAQNLKGEIEGKLGNKV